MEALVLPADPNDKYYLTHCYACTAVAKPDQEYIRNYGGVVCFSCRAFFRRAYQNNTAPNFFCKKGGGCEINVRNRRKCQKCRLDRCLEAGMNHEAILTEEQKQKRFRKMIQKREREREASMHVDHRTGAQGSGTQGVPRLTPSTSQIPSPDFRREEKDTLTLLRNIFRQLVEANEREVDQGAEAPPTTIFSVESTRRNVRLSRILSEKLELLQQSYSETIGTVSNEVLSLMTFINLTSKIHKKDILFYILRLSEEFRNFAYKQKCFLKLHTTDQEVLLNRNTPLFIQLKLVSYLLKPTDYSSGYSRASGQHLEDEPSLAKKKRKWLKHYHQNLHLEKFNSLCKLFKPGADLDEYGRLLHHVRFLRHLKSAEQRAVFSQVILFDRDTSTVLSNTEDIDDVTIQNTILYENFIEIYENSLSIEELTSALLRMAVFCSYYMDWDEIGVLSNLKDNSMVATLTVPYTCEEESWLNNQLKALDESFRSVQVGEEFVKEFILYSLNVPVSNQFIPHYLSAVLERMWRVLNSHSEFDEMSGKSKVAIMHCNGQRGMALITVRGENSTGLQQIQNGFGEFDEKIWREVYQPKLKNIDVIKGTSVKDSKALTSEQALRYEQLIADCGVLLADPTLFKVTLLLTLTTPNELGSSNLFFKLHEKYKLLLRRRIEWMYCSGNLPAALEYEGPENAFMRISRAIQNLDELAHFLELVLRRSSCKLPSYLMKDSSIKDA